MQFQNFLFFSLLITVHYSVCISLYKSSKLSDINSKLQVLQERNLELSKQIEENYKLTKQLTNELNSILESNNSNNNSNNNNTSYSNITIQFFGSQNKINANQQQQQQTQMNTNNVTHIKPKPIKHRHKRNKRIINYKPINNNNNHNEDLMNVNVENESDKVFKKYKVVKTPQMVQSERLLEYNTPTPFHHEDHSPEFKERIETMSHKVDSLIKKRDDLLMKAFTLSEGKYDIDYPHNINKTYIDIDDLLKTFLKQKHSISTYTK